MPLQLEHVMVEATPVASSADVDGGIILDDGVLGGLIMYEHLIERFNAALAACDCLGNPDDAIVFDDDSDGYECDLEVDDDQLDACEAEGEDECAAFAENCEILPLFEVFADVDVSGDGTNDVFSIGMEFEADAVIIVDVGQ